MVLAYKPFRLIPSSISLATHYTSISYDKYSLIFIINQVRIYISYIKIYKLSNNILLIK